MSTTLQLRRGNASAAAQYIGSAGELFIDTDNKVIHLMDGTTPGGTKISNFSTTLSGYGITDAYTQAQVNTLASNYYTQAQINSLASNYAPLASPTFTGTPTAPTPTAGDISTKVATTAYVSKYRNDIKSFGAKGDGVADDTLAVQNWVSSVLSLGYGYLSAGTYKCTTNIVLDLTHISNTGLTIIGDGVLNSTLNLTSVSSGIPFQVINANSFYVNLSEFGVHTSINGVGVAIGKEDFSDAINGSKFNLYCANSSTLSNSCALEINGVYQSVFNVVCNTGGTSTLGDACRIRQMQFCTLTGSFANSGNGIHFTGGYSFGNTILNPDIEEVSTCVTIDIGTASSNNFIGGQFSWSSYGINATAGSNNLFQNNNFASSSNVVQNSSGIGITGNGKSYGNVFYPTTYIRPTTGDATSFIDSVTGAQSSVVTLRNGIKRWQIRMDNSSESGSNNGSNLVFTRFDDTGANLGDAMYISRVNGQTTINKLEASTVGFFGASVVSSKPVVSGSKGGNAALASLISALSTLGLISDTTT